MKIFCIVVSTVQFIGWVVAMTLFSFANSYLAILGMVFGLVTSVLYFLPVYIADKRKHPNFEAIAALNLFGLWLPALVWALYKSQPVKVVVVRSPIDPTPIDPTPEPAPQPAPAPIPEPEPVEHSEPIRGNCSGCGVPYKVDPKYAGRAVKCPKCGEMMRIKSLLDVTV